MSKTPRTALMVVAIVLALVAWTQPQEEQEPTEDREALTLVVVSLEQNVLVATNDTGEELRLTVAEDAELPERPLQAGDRVNVWLQFDEALDQDVVVRIEHDETSDS